LTPKVMMFNESNESIGGFS